ncbi:MAG: MFS transporter [Prevotella sp.]|nr:MFS transporter [Prevotella sp.]MDY2634136.1 MFS transporter [Prevotella sp.]
MLKHLRTSRPTHRNPWTWLPLLYTAKGMPFAVLMTLSMFIYKRLSMDNAAIVWQTSFFLLPWIVKPLWRPYIDLYRTRRFWILLSEALIVIAVMGVARAVETRMGLNTITAFFWLLAIAASTHDTAVDGFYHLGIGSDRSIPMISVRRFFYRITFVWVQGIFVMVAGNLEVLTRSVASSWSMVVWTVAAVMALLFFFNALFLPRPDDHPLRLGEISSARLRRMFRANLNTFLRKPHAKVAVAFMAVCMLTEGMTARVTPLFLIDKTSIGGLGLSPQEFGFAQGTVGVLAMVVGGLAGNLLIGRYGLKRLMLPMLALFTLPKAALLYLAYTMPDSLLPVSLCLLIEQGGVGIGMAACLMFMVYHARGDRAAAHYGIAVALMSFSLWLSGICSGFLIDNFGYRTFYLVVMATTPAVFLVTLFLNIPSSFGITTQPSETDDRE